MNRLYQINIPTKVFFGRNIWREAVSVQDALLQGNILIVTTGRTLTRLGYVDEVCRELRKCHGVNHIAVFDHVSANPRLSEIQEGVAQGRRSQSDVIVGFGGGSAMDAAKAVAAGIKSDEDISAVFYAGKEPGGRVLPIIAIPTTAGTGSELSKAAIITDEIHRVKKGIRGEALFPAVAIVDSVFTESVPLRITMETGFDVMAHAVESFVSRMASPYTRMQSEAAVRIVGKYLRELAECVSNTEARIQMSYASMIMGINLAHAGTCLPHRLQYPVGAHTDSSHGAGLAALFPAWIRCEYRYAPKDVERMMSLLCGEETRGEEACITVIRKFIRSIGLASSLQEVGIRKEQLSAMAEEVSGNIQNDPASQEKEIITRLYQTAWQEENICRRS